MYTAFQIPVKYVKFGAHIYFELHKDDIIKDKFIVKYYYDGEMLLEKDYYEFKKRVSEIIWNEEKIKKFCFQNNENKDKEGEDSKSIKIDNLTIILFITNGIFFISTIVFISLFIFYKKKFNNAAGISVEPFMN